MAAPSILKLENSKEESILLPEVHDLAVRQICEDDHIIAALNSKKSHDSAEIILAQHYPSVLSALKLILTGEINSAFFFVIFLFFCYIL